MFLKEQELREELKWIEKLEKNVRFSLSRAPEGRLRCQMLRGKYPQYYIFKKDEKETHRNGRFLRKNELDEAKKLAQKEYDQKILKTLISRKKSIQTMLNSIMHDDVLKAFSSLPPAKRLLVKPYILPDDEFVKKWYQEHPGEQNFFLSDSTYTSEKGETVRSKTEKMIADKLYYKGIPYVYEPALRLKNGIIKYPDFLVLNVRTRKEYYYEHMGKMGNEEYVKKQMEKLDLYEQNNIYLGDNLLITIECKEKGINMRQVDSIIERYFS